MHSFQSRNHNTWLTTMYLTIDFDFSFVLSNLGYPISASIHTVNNKMDPCLKMRIWTRKL